MIHVKCAFVYVTYTLYVQPFRLLDSFTLKELIAMFTHFNKIQQEEYI